MFVISNSTDNKSSMTTIIFVNTCMILLAMRPFLAKKDVRFEII